MPLLRYSPIEKVLTSCPQFEPLSNSQWFTLLLAAFGFSHESSLGWHCPAIIGKLKDISAPKGNPIFIGYYCTARCIRENCSIYTINHIYRRIRSVQAWFCNKNAREYKAHFWYWETSICSRHKHKSNKSVYQSLLLYRCFFEVSALVVMSNRVSGYIFFKFIWRITGMNYLLGYDKHV